MSGAHSGRRPELRDEARQAREHERLPRNEDLAAGKGSGRSDPGEPMKSATEDAPVAAEEGRCASCGEEILPVPT